MQLVITKECPDGKVGQMVTVPDDKGRFMVAAGVARPATLRELCRPQGNGNLSAKLKGGLDA